MKDFSKLLFTELSFFFSHHLLFFYMSLLHPTHDLISSKTIEIKYGETLAESKYQEHYSLLD